MISLIDKIKECDLVSSGNRTEIYAKCKSLGNFINGGVSKLDKKELVELTNQLINYSQSTSDYRTFKFGCNEITLDDEQLQIVTAPNNCNIRICAAAGSGKTTTILCRIKYLIDKYTDPSSVLLLTFNREACFNLSTRLHQLFNFDIKLPIYTINAFCNLLIHSYGQEFGVYFNSVDEQCIDGLKIMEQIGPIIASRYKYIFFDEFQDVDEYQFRILQIFANNGCNVTIVGDDNQNIYQFRGTNNYYIINFDKLFPNVKTYMISTNYRSNAGIINIANTSISNNRDRILDKTMRVSPNNHSKELPKLLLFNNTHQEMEYITDKIKSLISNDHSYKDIAVISRGGCYLKILEEYLYKAGVPSTVLVTERGNENQIVNKTDTITLTTIHRAKGLEWKTVFLIGLADHHFPEHLNGNIENMDSERRLFYVAVTRAKEYLYFACNKKELPLSRFIYEINDEIESNATSDMFNTKDDNDIKKYYPITDVIDMIQGSEIKYLRGLNLIPIVKVSQLYEKTITINDSVSENNLEPDYSEFYDRILTREILQKINYPIKDYDTENVITDVDTQSFNYPGHFRDLLIDSYKLFKNTNKQNGEIMKSIYTVSLCKRINNGRKRLLYKDVYDLFTQDLKDINERIKDYADRVSQDEIDCKQRVFYEFTYVKRKIRISSEVGLINSTKGVLVDFRFSNSKECNIKWVIQTLLNYALLVENNNIYKNQIKKLAIFNVLTGKQYTFDIPEDHTILVKFATKLVQDAISNIRKHNFDGLDLFKLEDKNQIIPDSQNQEIIQEIVIPEKTINPENYICIDVEAGFDDIIQLAYSIYDNKMKQIKTVNKYIKNRLPGTSNQTAVHKITINQLQNGTEFVDVVNGLLKDLATCKYVVGHNVVVDTTHIKSDIKKYFKLNIDPFSDKIICDTMTMGKSVCNLKNTKGSVKPPKLCELYEFLLKKPMLNAHNAMYDVKATWSCYKELKKLIKQND